MMYAVLVYGAEDVFSCLPEEEQKAVRAGHGAFQAHMRGKDGLGAFARLTDSSGALTVRQSGGSVLVTDGPFAETKEQLLGLYLIECTTIDEAIEAAKLLPLSISSYEIRPVAYSDRDEAQGLNDGGRTRD